jgi:hypothetical protein
MKVSCLKQINNGIVFQFECDECFVSRVLVAKTRAAMQCACYLQHCGRRRTCLLRVRPYSRTIVNWRRAKYYFKIAEM